jgi:ABC-type transport system involved in multi-copper enzyme maturation permease subunit
VTAIAPHPSPARPGRDRFGRLVRAEWTKFRTVRGWVIAILLVPLLIVAAAFLYSSGSSCPGAGACPAPATGPGGQAVVDSFYFAHRALAGNGTITVRVTSLAGQYAAGSAAPGRTPRDLRRGVQPWSKAGLLITSGTAPGSAYAAMLVTGGHGARMQWNYTGDTAGLPGPVSASSPRWLRLTRAGDTVTGYDSPDGRHWTAVRRVVLAGLPRSAQVGLLATSPSWQATTQPLGGGATLPGGYSQATGRFDHLGLTWAGGGGPWTGSSIGARAFATAGPNPFTGSLRRAGGAFTVTGTGDIAPGVPETWAGTDTDTKLQDALLGVDFAPIAAIIVAALFVTAEYRRGLIRLTFAASPRRGRILAAKALVIGLVTFVLGLAGAAVALVVGARLMRSGGSPLLPTSALTEIRMAAGTAALLAVAAVLALALGTLARRGVAAITTVIVVIFVPLLLAAVPGLPIGLQDWLLRVTPAAAIAVTQSLPAYHQVLGFYQPAFGYYPLSWWAGLAVLCAWAAAALGGAVFALQRRDV